jgi:hypothetical protein
MHPPNHRPPETSFGESHQREDTLSREAHHSRVARWVRAIAKVAVVLVIVGLVALLVVGPGKAIDWLGTYVFPVAVILAVGLYVLVLLVGLLLKIPFPRGWDRD